MLLSIKLGKARLATTTYFELPVHKLCLIVV
jgi:hypothetical protein